MDVNTNILAKDIRTTLSTLWIWVLFNMLFRDMHEFARTGFLEELLAMTSNGAQIPEGLLLGAAIGLEIPMSMIFLTQVLEVKVNRWANLIAAVITIVMIVSNNLAPDLDDVFFAVVECAALLLVIWHAWRWSNDQPSIHSIELLTGDSNMKMKAIVCAQYGAPDVLKLQQVDKPVPRDNEVLVKVHAATATATGLGARTGKPVIARLFSGLTKPKHSILGVEFAGEIAAIGKDVTQFEVGDPVFGMTGATTPGAYAEYKCMPEDGAVLLKPNNISYDDAAAIVEGGLTALNFLHNKAHLQPGQKVLIYGASGSVGTASIQVAKSFGADVTAVCSSANFKLVKSIGADRVIDYRKDDFTKNGQQYDIVFDTVGKGSFTACKGSLTPNGLYLNAGSAATILPMLWTRVFTTGQIL